MRYLTVFLLFLLAGCAAGYTVSEDTDKFSDPNKPAVVSMKGNDIDFGGPMVTIPTNQLNGFVSRDRVTRKLMNVGFFFKRAAYSGEITFNGGPKWLNVNPGNELVFLADGERISIPAITGSIDHKVERGFGTSVETLYLDFAQYHVTADQFRRISMAKTLEFQVSGTQGSTTYPRPNRKLLDSFLPNLKKFYETEIIKP
jgi:hypothetical protein